MVHHVSVAAVYAVALYAFCIVYMLYSTLYWTLGLLILALPRSTVCAIVEPFIIPTSSVVFNFNILHDSACRFFYIAVCVFSETVERKSAKKEIQNLIQ